ncbi:hypothetical protein BO70DRAFT_398329 [Aspergillus heteromorphus CBS 117.55]|uniref:Zn(2)-C6 fungal-type domain-containing protein n=1 Tax=Aspergillus heteromorphus CBS 117.55 TaxID=1448321 RepID=A0A317VQB4_9EURO|nr:uncharacterized protein BO70DRAFT_398329 [Aspergillus heteromorphus CBS 117.55]PWY75481.1 hypothetical protein BO70DRAFT_398329 [Aspergillus heteromorphus CBS 117.55]
MRDNCRGIRPGQRPFHPYTNTRSCHLDLTHRSEYHCRIPTPPLASTIRSLRLSILNGDTTTLAMAGTESGRPSGSDKPLRYACDRCHTQKLRCLRAHVTDTLNQKEPCLRCQKAHTPCIISAANKVGRPPKSSSKKSRASSASPKSSDTIYAASRRFVLDVDGDGINELTRDHPPVQSINARDDISMFSPNQLYNLPRLAAQLQSSFPVMSDSGVSINTETPATRSLSSICGEELEEKDGDNQDFGREMSMWPTQDDYLGYECLSLGPNGGPITGVNEIGVPHYPEMYDGVYRNGSLIYPASSGPFDAQRLILSNTPQVNPVPPASTKEAGLNIAQNLNSNLLRLSEKARATTGQALKAAAGRENEVVSQMVQFARELIDLVPRIISISRTNRASTVGHSGPGVLHKPRNTISALGGSYYSPNAGSCSQYDSILHSPTAAYVKTTALQRDLLVNVGVNPR